MMLTTETKCLGYMSNKIISELKISAFANVRLKSFYLSEIISELFQRNIAPREYFPTCSMSLK